MSLESGLGHFEPQSVRPPELFSLFDTFNPNFEIVEPKTSSNWQRFVLGLALPPAERNGRCGSRLCENSNAVLPHLEF
jgi:hypothetical protein